MLGIIFLICLSIFVLIITLIFLKSVKEVSEFDKK